MYVALIQCPECFKDISQVASACPGCGLTLTTEIVAAQVAQRIAIEKRNNSPAAVGVVFGVFVLLGLLCAGLNSKGTAPSASTTSYPSLEELKFQRAADLGHWTDDDKDVVRRELGTP
jgi:hypothetical protein